jgi:hypothetical protein
MKKHALLIISVFIILSGIAMLFFGLSMFSYQGPPLSNFMSGVGKYSFMLWLPTIALGLALLIFYIRMRD